MRRLILVALLLTGCQHAGTNIAAPDVATLQTNNQREQQTTRRLKSDVQDAKDIVRQIEYKDALLSR